VWAGKLLALLAVSILVITWLRDVQLIGIKLGCLSALHLLAMS